MSARVKIKTKAPKKRRESLRRYSDLKNGLLFCLPWVAGFCALTLYPLLQTLIFSFNTVNIKPGGVVELVGAGFNNYIYAIANDTEFLEVLLQYVTKTVLYVPVITVMSLILAVLLNAKIRGTGLFRTIFFLPVIIVSGPVIGMFIEQGVAEFPGVADFLNIEEMYQSVPAFIVDALGFLISEFIMILWYSGIQILIFLTGLQKIDKSMYEAAAIDGASAWEVFWSIIMPALSPIIMINLVFTVIMQSTFSLNPVIVKIKADMNSTGEGSGNGYAAAMAWMYFVVLLALLGLFLLLFKLIFTRRPKKYAA